MQKDPNSSSQSWKSNAQNGGQKIIIAQMIKTQEQNNHESKLTSARGVVAEKRRRELHWMRELKKKKEIGVSLK